MKTLKILTLMLFATVQLHAQVTQSIRGKVVDKQSKFPLSGVSVLLTTTNPIKGAQTDEQGEFKISDVPIGRHDLKITQMGYAERTIFNISLTAGKEVYLEIDLEEEIIETEEIIIQVEKDKTEPNDQNSLISTRGFTIDETNRYAGTLNDPARMAMNFAGVTGTNDTRNDIIIRGNSPLGVLWRIEGVDIPNPNHFGSFGTTGGPISMLNNNVLSNSDFMTGSWPSQYGNALAGVFDLQMRKGNNQKREYMVQLGFNGIEAGVEGPFSKKKPYSYLANYRYSTLGVFKALGINFGTSALPQYQDLNFKLHFPTEKAGTFTVFGIGGISKVTVSGAEVDTTDIYSDPGDNTYFISHMGVIGFTNTLFLNKTTSSKIGLVFSGTRTFVTNDSIPKDPMGGYTSTPIPDYRSEFSQVKYSLNYTLTKKFTAKNNITAGLLADVYDFYLVDSILYGSSFVNLRNFDGVTMLGQVYSNWQHRFSDKLTLNSGLHLQYFAFNSTAAIEPRVAFKYQLKADKSVSMGYGLHSQLQPFQAYFREDRLANGEYIRTNKDLDFTKSHHLIAGYDQSFSKYLRLKAEAYYQYLYHVPVERRPTSFSTLNSGADFGIFAPDSLVNEGTGENYGVELTFEKFYSKGYYFLATSSIYNSTYRGSDGVKRNTAFNGNYTFNILGGKEFRIKEKHVFSIDLKAVWAGGRRYTPIDLPKSIALHSEVRIDSLAYSGQLPDYIRVNAKIGFTLNGKKTTQEWALDVQNIFNRKNAFIQKYNIQLQRVIIVPQLGIFPVIQYRLTF